MADAAFSGRREQALEELRWAVDAGTPPVLVTSAFAGGARGLARYKSAPPRMNERRPRPRGRGAAVEAAVRPRPVPRLVGGGLVRAIRAVAQADADIKGAASDASYTLERLVLTITEPARASNR